MIVPGQSLACFNVKWDMPLAVIMHMRLPVFICQHASTACMVNPQK